MNERLQPVDHSLNLNEPPDERDLGQGILVLPNGQVRQRSRPNEPPDEPESMPFPRSRQSRESPPLGY